MWNAILYYPRGGITVMKMIWSVVTGAALMVMSGCLYGVDAPSLGEPVDVSFKARVDGTTQYYVKMLPVGFDKSKTHNILIALHGGPSDRWQFAKDTRDDCRGSRDVATKYDMIYICPDFRGASWMGVKAESDVLQIIRDIHRQYKTDKIFIIGASMGGASALTFAALHPELVAGVVAENATGNLLDRDSSPDDSVARSFGGTSSQIPAEYKKRSAEYWPERLTMPIAFTIGGKDSLMSPKSVLRMSSVLEKIGRKVLMINRPENDHLTSYEDTLSALEFVIKASK